MMKPDAIEEELPAACERGALQLRPAKKSDRARLVTEARRLIGRLAQIQLSSFLRVQKNPNYRSWLNRIIQKSADVLVCEKDFSIVDQAVMR